MLSLWVGAEKRQMKHKIEIYTVKGVSKCDIACQIFESRGIPFENIVVGIDMNLIVEMWARSECHTIPQIFIDDVHIGSLPELLDMVESGEIDKLAEEYQQ